MRDKHFKVFCEETRELLAELEGELLKLEQCPGDHQSIDHVFRIVHTIKGSASMFGLDSISGFLHEVEDLFESVRNGKVAVTKELITLSLAARDMVRAIMDNVEQETGQTPQGLAALLANIRRLVPPPGETSCPHPQASLRAPHEGSSAQAAECPEESYYLRLKFSKEIYNRGLDPADVLEELGSLGLCEVKVHTEDLPPLGEMDPGLCYLWWEVNLTTTRGRDALEDVLVFVKEDGDILVREGRAPAACAKERAVALEKPGASEDHGSIRVPAERLDTLVNLAGEIVTVQASLSQYARNWEDFDMLSSRADGIFIKADQVNRLFAIAERMERLVDELRDNVMGIRMLPIGITFGRYRRLVRDLSLSLGKEVNLETQGGETELDKTVLDRLNDPLVHLIRNCLDHGLERPEEREAAGKPRTGTVRLAAEHAGAHVLIHISDDGRGLDREKIRARAVQKGLLAEDAQMTERDLEDMLFMPGFSTSEVASSVSGRGVGMDVVRKSIDALGGSIVLGGGQGKGLSLTLSLPLTMAIIDGLLVEVDRGKYIIPLSAVEECVELTRQDTANSHGRRIAHVRQESIPYVVLRELFSLTGEVPEFQQIIITRTEGRRVGFVVDSVVGQNQTVIKSLGAMHRNIRNISGASILGDGSMALILDTKQIVASVERTERQVYG